MPTCRGSEDTVGPGTDEKQNDAEGGIRYGDERPDDPPEAASRSCSARAGRYAAPHSTNCPSL
ncbi:hypothetical protein [Salinibacter ruber]|uniref:Uncharacterized protein n=1 Tax=Salinibacter ruber TaxID=146919 RepID=A0A9X3A6T3_9BACT|nr:hypothetical protein [Salinibacter ruber]MCS4059362.1 hypothetical protein [Salinibacter ruber]MCS4119908.1 hypothetical protein [Salinibacter ruber]MCS4135881.1 hypothetical protein [Salinibacter ruber]MCS4160593.1 hypothetical protein [Salinibacter ruber]